MNAQAFASFSAESRALTLKESHSLHTVVRSETRTLPKG
jgi:hypothetical protein